MTKNIEGVVAYNAEYRVERPETGPLLEVYRTVLMDSKTQSKRKIVVTFAWMDYKTLICIVRRGTNGTGTPYVGIAIKHPNDDTDIAVAKKIALKRAIEHMMYDCDVSQETERAKNYKRKVTSVVNVLWSCIRFGYNKNTSEKIGDLSIPEFEEEVAKSKSNVSDIIKSNSVIVDIISNVNNFMSDLEKITNNRDKKIEANK